MTKEGPTRLERIFMAAEARHQENRSGIIEVVGPYGWDLIDQMHAVSDVIVTLEEGTRYVLPPATDAEPHLGVVPYILVTMQRLMEQEGIRDRETNDLFERASHSMACTHLAGAPLTSGDTYISPVVEASHLLERAAGSRSLTADLDAYLDRCSDLLGGGADAVLFTYFVSDIGEKLISDLRKIHRLRKLAVLLISPYDMGFERLGITTIRVRHGV